MLQFGLAAALEVLHAAIGGEACWIPEVGVWNELHSLPHMSSSRGRLNPHQPAGDPQVKHLQKVNWHQHVRKKYRVRGNLDNAVFLVIRYFALVGRVVTHTVRGKLFVRSFHRHFFPHFKH